MTALLAKPKSSNSVRSLNNADAFERAAVESRWKDFMDAKIEHLEKKRGP